MTPNIGGGITAAATCPATTTQEETVVNCPTEIGCAHTAIGCTIEGLCISDGCA